MPDPVEIFNFRRIDGRLTTSGQPTENQLPALAKLGVTHVINLALHEHPDALADEAASLAKLGIGYTHIPVAFDAPQESDFTAFCTAFETHQDTPLHVHCIANMRVTAFLYRYWREKQGLDEATARAPMDTIWQPGGVWAAFMGDAANSDKPHRTPEGKAWT